MTGAALALAGGLLLMLFWATSRAAGTVFAPASIWNFGWGILFVSAAVFGANYNYAFSAMAALLLLVASFSLSCSFMNRVMTTTAPARAAAVGSLRVPNVLLWICAGISLAGVQIINSTFGISIFDAQGLQSLFAVASLNAGAMFRGDVSLPAAASVAFAVMQAGWALAGARFKSGPDTNSFCAMAVLALSALACSAATTQRSYLLVPIVWWIGGYVAAAVIRGEYRLSARIIRRSTFGAAGVVAAVVFLRAIRTHGSDASFTANDLDASRVWVAGYLPAFSDWMSRDADVSDTTHGLMGGITGLLGQESVDLTGNYYQVIDDQGLVSNAATVMRDVVAAGGLMWGVLIVLLFGALSQYLYVRTKRGGLVASAGYAGVVAALLWAPNAWFFAYGSRVLGLILLLGIATAAVLAGAMRTRTPAAVTPSFRESRLSFHSSAGDRSDAKSDRRAERLRG